MLDILAWHVILDAAARHPLRVCRSYQVAGQPLRRIIPGPERDLGWQERL
jgi:hypothetical protein